VSGRHRASKQLARAEQAARESGHMHGTSRDGRQEADMCTSYHHHLSDCGACKRVAMVRRPHTHANVNCHRRHTSTDEFDPSVQYAMGTELSVMLVSNEGQEFSVPMDVLSSASPVWRERLIFNGVIAKASRSEETCTCDEIQAFIKVISLTSQDSETSISSLDVTTLLRALPLIHKYDCKGATMMLDSLESRYFPGDGIVKLKLNVTDKSGNVIAQPSSLLITEKWVTQAHFDYIVLKQELYGHEALTYYMQRLLAVVMVHGRGICGKVGPILCRNGMSMPSNRSKLLGTLDRPTISMYELEVEEDDDDDEKEDVGPPGPLLKLQAWRLGKETIMSLFGFLKAAHEII
jgi:hypothetical protein